MSVMQHPAEEDYWNAGQSGPIVYPNFKIWMSHKRVHRRCYNRQSQDSMQCKSTIKLCVEVKANQERLDSLAADCQHLPWEMTGETVMLIVRDDKHTGMDNMPYSSMHWNMGNWFTSKPLFDELLQLKQYTYGTMERKWYVTPFLTHGKPKKPKLTVQKGTMKAGHSKDGKSQSGPTWKDS
eukprot:15327596-Ditylum_brightwellii.AAC.1